MYVPFSMSCVQSRRKSWKSKSFLSNVTCLPIRFNCSFNRATFSLVLFRLYKGINPKRVKPPNIKSEKSFHIKVLGFPFPNNANV